MADTSGRRRGAHFSNTDAAGSAAASARGARPEGQGQVHRARHLAVSGTSAAGGMSQLATPRSRAQRASAARGGHSHRGPLVGLMVATLLVVALVVAFVVFRTSDAAVGQDALSNQGTQVNVVIASGSDAQAIASTLHDAGLITDSGEFVTELRRQGADSSLKSGSYVLTVGTDVDDIIKQLQAGPNTTAGRLTISEGLTVTKTAEAVEDALGIQAADFVAQAKASNYVASYPFLADVSDDSLEGFLYPKTYDFSGQASVTPDIVIRAMLDQYAAEVATLDFSAGRALIKQRYGLDVSDYDILKLASIVEREAVTQQQRPKVSSTFYNRLALGMSLQSDATMAYVTGGKVSADDLTQQSPYNTYLNSGLTPTPICTPSLESIEAALNPDDTDYLYFYITQDQEWFSATYDEHLRAIEQDN